jgi:hypothetical protein
MTAAERLAAARTDDAPRAADIAGGKMSRRLRTMEPNEPDAPLSSRVMETPVDEADSERQRLEVRAIILSAAVIGFLGFATVLIGAAVVNIRDNNPQTAAPAASQPTVTTGQSQDKAPPQAPQEKAPTQQVK